MGDRREGRGRGSSDDLSRRVGCDDLGELVFEPPKLDHQRVVVGVADLGRVEQVVALVVVADLLSQRVDPGGDLVGDGHPPRLSRPPPDRSESRKRGWSGAEGELRGDRLVEHAVGEILRETQHPIRLLDRVR